MTLSWNNRTSIITITSLVAVLSVPALAHAQRGGGGGRGRAVVAARPVVVSPFFSPYFSPFYSRYYDPFFFDVYGWGFPGFYAPAFYNRGMVEDSSARIQVTPRQTEVYVDGYLAGVVDDFDGMTQRLRVTPGEHEIELYLDGHRTISQTIAFAPGQSYRIRHTMEPLVAGEAAPARPTPRPGAQAPAPRGPFDAFGQPYGRGPAPQPGMSGGREGSTLAIRVQPGDATILIDGERWQGSGSERLEIQVTPGEHRIEIQKDGYQPFTSTVRVRPGETNAVNVSLTKSGDE